MIFGSEAGSSRKQGTARILPDSLFGGDKLCSSISVGSTPMKMLVDDEVSGDVRHASPSIVGRLMGLDTMPSFGDRSHSTCRICSQFMSAGSYCDKYGFSGDVPHKRSTDQIPEFKDVFEVMESARMKTQSLSSGCTNICSGPNKVNSAEMNFVRQKFMDAKRLSTKKTCKRSKEFDGALEALVLNKDLLLEFLQKSNHFPTKDSTDISCSPFSAVNRITVLKPSRRNKFVDADVIYPSEDTKRCCRAPKGVKHSPTNPCANHSSQHPQENTSSFRQKFPRSSFKERTDTHCSPTRIVVLKPCLGKTENMEGAFPLTHEMFQSSYRKSKATLDYGSAAQSRHTEEYMYQMPTGKFDVLGRGGQGSIEIACEVTEEMTRAVKGGISGNRIFSPDIGPFSCDAQASLLSSMAKLKSSEACQRSNRCHDAWDGPNSGHSPAYSTKTSIRKEAKRRLSYRWKITNQYQHPSQDANSFRTLGDMLTLSDNEVSKFTSGSSICCKCPKGELHRDGMPGLCGYPLGISSNDGWKDENVCNSTRLKSLPSSSITQKSLKMTRRKEKSRLGEFSVLKDQFIVAHNNSEDELVHGRPMRSLVRTSTHCNESDLPSLDGDESMVTECEINVNFEEPACSVSVPDSSEERLVQPANSKHFLSAECYLDSSYVVPEWQDEDQPSVSGNLVMHQESTWVLDDHIVSPSPNDSANEAEEHVLGQCVGHAFTSNPTEESVSHVSSREDDQPPVSVFESSLGAEDGCSGGFEKISADLQELRMQLRLLKIEATYNDDETELALSSNDGISASCKPRNEAGQMSDTFWDADERDFAYVLDILTCLGIQCDEQDFLLNACYLWEYPAPAGSDVYESLEKKYGKYILWPQSDRRLLFDLTNDALMGVVTSLTDRGMRKKWQSKRRGKEGVSDHVWERVCQQRREAECFQEERLMGVGWLDCEDVTYQIAGELESMLGADLLEEVAELLL
ncbi:hypothetical protein GQ55_2G487300 [Panicum hallii var. hallii]|uniref:DUF4378 domain-containing protein n=1 Tax=Panicum hallii var. hallii TaxID=1504633 RepID=A0A2T7F0J8_9POAL|nr:hypothetical protein GQ55_2G487300 [Panicum hallii var. hallii]